MLNRTRHAPVRCYCSYKDIIMRRQLWNDIEENKAERLDSVFSVVTVIIRYAKPAWAVATLQSDVLFA